MSVESQWWNNHSGKDLNPGQIISVHFTGDDAKNAKYFTLKTDVDGHTYPMRYDAVLKYVDKNHPKIHEYYLPVGMLDYPREKEKKRRKYNEVKSSLVINLHYCTVSLVCCVAVRI